MNHYINNFDDFVKKLGDGVQLVTWLHVVESSQFRFLLMIQTIFWESLSFSQKPRKNAYFHFPLFIPLTGATKFANKTILASASVRITSFPFWILTRELIWTWDLGLSIHSPKLTILFGVAQLFLHKNKFFWNDSNSFVYLHPFNWV